VAVLLAVAADWLLKASNEQFREFLYHLPEGLSTRTEAYREQ